MKQKFDEYALKSVHKSEGKKAGKDTENTDKYAEA